MRRVLGIDIGSSSTQGLLSTTDGKVLARASKAHTIDRPRPNWAEQNARLVWRGETLDVIGQLLATAGRQVDGVCISGMGPCVLLADDVGEPLRAAILYGVDARALHEIDILNTELGNAAVLERCGSLLSSQAVGPKLLWLATHEPDVWRRAKRFFMPSSYLVYLLTGEYILDQHSASQCVPMYDLRRQDWHPEWADRVAPGLPLPRLLWPGQVAGTVSKAGSELSGLPVGTPVLAGTIDAWAEATSVGVLEPGDTMLMYGTSMFIVSVTTQQQGRTSVWLTNGVAPQTRTFAAGMSAFGAATAWLRGTLGLDSFSDLEAEACASPAGARGIVVLPYFAGERSPIFDPEARGVVIGLHLSQTRADLYRALLEGTAFAVRHNIETLTEAGAKITSLRATGGGTSSALWTQIISDVTGIPQEVPSSSGAALGDCLLASSALEGSPLRSYQTELRSVSFRPDPNNHSVYEDLYPLFRGLYTATMEQVHELARQQDNAARANESDIISV